MAADGATTSYTYNDLDRMLTSGGTTFANEPRGSLPQTMGGRDVKTSV